MISHPNRSKQPLPIYPHGGFNARSKEPIGYASDAAQAGDLAREWGVRESNKRGRANGAEWEIIVTGVELLQDEKGRYYVVTRRGPF